jgi:hypothetical protein
VISRICVRRVATADASIRYLRPLSVIVSSFLNIQLGIPHDSTSQSLSNAEMHLCEFSELIPGLPEELALECLTRMHYATHRVSAQVCRRWRQLLHSRDFYYHRKQFGYTRKAACLVQSLPVGPGCNGSKPVGQPAYGVSVFDPERRGKDMPETRSFCAAEPFFFFLLLLS